MLQIKNLIVKSGLLLLGMTVLISWCMPDAECKLSVVKANSKYGEMSFEYVYKGNMISKLLKKRDGKVTGAIVCSYDAAGRLSKVEDDLKGAVYSYNQAGKLAKIEGNGLFATTTVFEYNDKGQITKETVLGNNEKLYTYDEQGNPVLVKLMVKGKVIETYEYTYDNKKNPIKDLHPFADVNQYAVQFGSHNILSCVVTYNEEESYDNQVLHAKGSKETSTYTYEYNEHDYPVKLTNDKGFFLEYAYACQ